MSVNIPIHIYLCVHVCVRACVRLSAYIYIYISVTYTLEISPFQSIFYGWRINRYEIAGKGTWEINV